MVVMFHVEHQEARKPNRRAEMFHVKRRNREYGNEKDGAIEDKEVKKIAA